MKKGLLPGHLVLKTVSKEEIILSIECDTCQGGGVVEDEDPEGFTVPCNECEGLGQLLMPNGGVLLEFLRVFKN